MILVILVVGLEDWVNTNTPQRPHSFMSQGFPPSESLRAILPPLLCGELSQCRHLPQARLREHTDISRNSYQMESGAGCTQEET